MKNAFIFTSGMAVGAAGFAVFSVAAIGIGLVGIGLELSRMNDEGETDNGA